MAGRHSLYPGFIRLFYTSNGHSHRQVLPVQPNTPAAGTALKLHDGSVGAGDWTDDITEWVSLVKVFFHTADNFDSAELWTLASPTADPIFRETFSLGIAGTNAGADTPAGQGVLTFRGNEGERSLIYLMEGVISSSLRQAYADFDSATKALADFVTAPDGWIFGRDNNYPIATLNFTGKVNDQLRKKYFLS